MKFEATATGGLEQACPLLTVHLTGLPHDNEDATTFCLSWEAFKETELRPRLSLQKVKSLPFTVFDGKIWRGRTPIRPAPLRRAGASIARTARRFDNGGAVHLKTHRPHDHSDIHLRQCV